MYSNPATRPLFRLLLPLVIGCVVYLLVLLAFDTVNRVLDDFFNQELLVCIAMSYLILECNRLLVLIFRKQLFQTKYLRILTLAIVCCALMLTVLITSSTLMLYFYQVENLTNMASFVTELRVFNGIFLFIAFLYHTYFLGFFWIYQQFQYKVENEAHVTEILENQIKHFHHVLHPGFLLSGLESILLRLKEKQFEKADEGILLLSEIYRYLLKQHDELIALEEEMQVIKNLESFLLEYSPYYLAIKVSVSDLNSLIVPRTLLRLLEAVASSQLSSKHAPLVVSLHEADEQVIVSFPSNFSLTNGDKLYKMLEQVRLQYTWLEKELRWEETDYFKIFIPTATIESIVTVPEPINQQIEENENHTPHHKRSRK